MIQYQDYPGEYIKKFDDTDPETFVWVGKTASDDPEYLTLQEWLGAGNELLPAPPEPTPSEPTPSAPVIVVDAEFLEEVQSASTINDMKQAILNAVFRAQTPP